eukprot:g255.t1
MLKENVPNNYDAAEEEGSSRQVVVIEGVLRKCSGVVIFGRKQWRKRWEDVAMHLLRNAFRSSVHETTLEHVLSSSRLDADSRTGSCSTSDADWDTRFQKIVDEWARCKRESVASSDKNKVVDDEDTKRKGDVSVRCALEMMRLQRDMGSAAVSEIRRLIETSPLSASGSRGKTKSSTWTRDHIWIRVLDCGDEEDEDVDGDVGGILSLPTSEEEAFVSRKVGGHEIKTSSALLDAILRVEMSATDTVDTGTDSKRDAEDKNTGRSNRPPRLCVMLQCVVDYLGFRAIATAIPPCNFSDDIDETDHLRTRLKPIAKTLGVDPSEFGEGAELRPCENDRTYVLYMTYATPPDVVDKERRVRLSDQIACCRLRTSSARSQTIPLAMKTYRVFSTNGPAATDDDDGEGPEENVRVRASRDKEECRIEETYGRSAAFARSVGRELRREGARRFAAALDDCRASPVHLVGRTLARMAHEFGLNVRHFGIVRSYARTPHTRRALEIDMVARSFKRVLNRQLRQLLRRVKRAGAFASVRSRSDVVSRSVVLANSALQLTIAPASDDESRRWWETVLLPTIRSQFLGAAKCPFAYLPPANQPAAAEMRAALAHACAYHAGLVVPALRNTPSPNDDVGDSDGAPMFQPARVVVVALRPRVKFMGLPDEDLALASTRARKAGSDYRSISAGLRLASAVALEDAQDASSVSIATLRSVDCAAREAVVRTRSEVSTLASRAFREVLARSPVGHSTLAVAYVRHTYHLWSRGDRTGAESAYSRARQVIRRYGGERHPMLCVWPVAFARLHVSTAFRNRRIAAALRARAIELLRDAVRVGEMTLLNEHWDFRRVHALLANVFVSMGRGDTEQGRSALQRAEVANRADVSDSPTSPRALFTLSCALCASDRLLEAERNLKRCIRVCASNVARSRGRLQSLLVTKTRARQLLANTLIARGAENITDSISQLNLAILEIGKSLSSSSSSSESDTRFAETLPSSTVGRCVVEASNGPLFACKDVGYAENSTTIDALRSTLIDLCGLIVSRADEATWTDLVCFLRREKCSTLEISKCASSSAILRLVRGESSPSVQITKSFALAKRTTTMDNTERPGIPEGDRGLLLFVLSLARVSDAASSRFVGSSSLLL